jgi:tripeptidyl-peptidase II
MDSKKVEEGKVDNDDEFLDGLIPSEETQAKDFMTTEANGNGVIVAVFDTGCDPAADGLQTCPDGSPKIVDIVDATGCCDVSMDKVVDLPEKNENDWIELKGLSGRTLKLDAKLTNPTKKFRLGLKQAYELFSKPLVKRMKSERKRVFDEKHEKLLRQVQNKLVSFERNDNNKDKKKEKEDLEARISCLKDTMKSYQDLGPIYDCVVYHDGKEWLALVDTSETGDLRDKTPMTNYRVRFEHDTCDDISMQTYCVNIYDEGRTLSVVTDAGAHGTHVASIIGAYDKDREELRGIAPGCKIVAVRIGDRRVSGSMETCLGMVRAADAVRRNRCDVVNMSYGEPTVSCSTSNSAVLKEFRDLVEKDNVIFVTSAGNAGPALSTCGAPCEPLSDVVIGVGAYVSKDMMSAQYSLLENIPQTAFTWTSVGPSRNGHLGVTIMAPGTQFLSLSLSLSLIHTHTHINILHTHAHTHTHT